MVAGAGEPRLDGYLHLASGCFLVIAECGGEAEIGDIGDPAGVLGGPEEIDVVLGRGASHRESAQLILPIA